MGDAEHRARETVEQIFKCGKGFDVEVIRGFVEHEHVGSGHEESGELQSATFATREISDRRPLRLRAEAEFLAQLRCGELATFAEIHPFGNTLHGFEQSPRGIQLLEVLTQICRFHRDAGDEFADVRLDVAEQHADERCLARTVHSDDADAIPGPHIPGLPAQEQGVPNGEIGVVQFEHRFPEACAGEAEQLDAVSRRRFTVDKLIRGIDAELRLRGSCRCSATQPGQLLSQEIPTTCILRAGLSRALGLGKHVCAVPALVFLDRTIHDFPHAITDLVEEPTVMCDDDDGKIPSRFQV